MFRKSLEIFHALTAVREGNEMAGVLKIKGD
jgi:hypothetical protein